MSLDAHKNFAVSTVTSAPSPATSGTSLVVSNGALFPVAPFNCTVWPSGTQPTSANAEIVRVTAVATNTFTIVRTQEGSSTRTIVIGDQIALTITAKVLTDIEGYVSHLTSDGLTFSGAVNGTTGTFSGTVTTPTVSATNGTFSGTVTGVTGTFSGNVSAANYGAVNGTTAVFSSSLNAASGTFAGAVTAGPITASNAIISNAQGSRFGGASGSATSPTLANTNILLYNNGATNWSGLGSDTSGNFYLVTGISGTPSTRLKIDPTGAVTIGGATTVGSLTSNGAVAITGVLSCNSSLSTFVDACPIMRGYQERYQVVAASSSTTIDISSGNHIVLTLGTDISSFTLTTSLFGLLANYVQPIVFHIQGNGTAHSINWTISGSPVRFSGGVPPTIASSNGAITRVVIYYMSGYAVFGELIGYNA